MGQRLAAAPHVRLAGRWVALWHVLWPAAALVAPLAGGQDLRSTSLLGFFTLALVWPAALVAHRAAGVRAGIAVSFLYVLLVALRLPLGHPTVRSEPQDLIRAFTGPAEIAQYSVRVPFRSAEWKRLWEVAEPPVPYLYVRMALATSRAEADVDVLFNGMNAGRFTAETKAVDAGTLNGWKIVWYRLPVERTLLETDQPLEVQVGPRPDSFVRDTVGLTGGFSFRPQVAHPSAFFNGVSWLTDGCAMLPPSPALRDGQPTTDSDCDGDRRFSIEVRVVERKSGTLRAVYY